MYRHLAMAAVALLLFGCTAGGDEGGDGEGGETGSSVSVDPAEAARAPGVTDDTIKVGVTSVDYEAIREFTDIPHGTTRPPTGPCSTTSTPTAVSTAA